MSLEKRQLIEREVERLCVKTGIAAQTLAGFAGVSGRTWRAWQGWRGRETRHNGHIPREHGVTPVAAAASIPYGRERMEAGYRVLCWQMVDANIAAVSPGTVYNVLKRGGLTKKWAETREEAKQGFPQPVAIAHRFFIPQGMRELFLLCPRAGRLQPEDTVVGAI
jgi:hypothetical protein